MASAKKLRRRAAEAAALAEIERLTQLAKTVRVVEQAVASARIAKGGRVIPPGEAAERDYIAGVLAKSDNAELRAGAMSRLAELDGQGAAMDETLRVIRKSGRSK